MRSIFPICLALAPGLAWAHGATFGATALSVNHDDPDEIWAVMQSWGLVHTTDGGQTWEWVCEERLGSTEVYDVLAIGPDDAIVATRSGVFRVGGDCSTETIAGFPEGTYSNRVVRGPDGGFVVVGTDADDGGFWSCTVDGCVASELTGAGIFPKSLYTDGDRVWGTVVYEGTLASELWRTDDGEHWTRTFTWPDGDTDPRVLYADGDDVYIWARPRSDATVPGLLVSHDGGVTFTRTFETGYYTDATPGFTTLGGRLFLGSNAGARTWVSDDDGETFTDISTDAPGVRCGDFDGEHAWACADHLADGVDVAVTTDGTYWTPIGCLETAVVAPCAEDTCAALYDAFETAGSYGGGKCDTVIGPEDAPKDEEKPCGCGGGSAALILVVGALGWRRRLPFPEA